MSESVAKRGMLVLLLVAAGCASSPEEPPDMSTGTPLRLIEGHERHLAAGQMIRYTVTYLFLTVGEVVFRYHSTADERTLRVTSATSPTPIAAALSRFGGFATTWLDPVTLLPRRYTWNSMDGKRRYNTFDPARPEVLGLEIEPDDEWDVARLAAAVAHDPVSVLTLMRVIDLAPGDSVSFHLIEGHRDRLCTITAQADVEFKVGPRRTRPARRFRFHVIRLEDGEPTDDPAEMDMHNWVSLDEPRVILQSKGRIRDARITIRLAEYLPGPAAETPESASAPIQSLSPSR